MADPIQYRYADIHEKVVDLPRPQYQGMEGVREKYPYDIEQHPEKNEIEHKSQHKSSKEKTHSLRIIDKRTTGSLIRLKHTKKCRRLKKIDVDHHNEE